MDVAFLATFIYTDHIVLPLFVSMSAADEAEVASTMPVDPAPAEPAVVETQPQKPPKEKKPKAPKEKKKKPKEGPSHPPYFQMIKEALVALQEKSGSSSYAIAKYMEEKHRPIHSALMISSDL
ncbi:hypothetical protein MRB53_012814 [Persea americana]|uniref:Uncharacterized protein n=1 Tax=Persea americana TaxID=3435 RepID=A0ACC2LYI9_PERAE|nr:hypothetical protein MRB53_012814 [Persea americana]